MGIKILNIIIILSQRVAPNKLKKRDFEHMQKHVFEYLFERMLENQIRASLIVFLSDFEHGVNFLIFLDLLFFSVCNKSEVKLVKIIKFVV